MVYKVHHRASINVFFARTLSQVEVVAKQAQEAYSFRLSSLEELGEEFSSFLWELSKDTYAKYRYFNRFKLLVEAVTGEKVNTACGLMAVGLAFETFKGYSFYK